MKKDIDIVKKLESKITTYKKVVSINIMNEINIYFDCMEIKKYNEKDIKLLKESVEKIYSFLYLNKNNFKKIYEPFFNYISKNIGNISDIYLKLVFLHIIQSEYKRRNIIDESIYLNIEMINLIIENSIENEIEEYFVILINSLYNLLYNSELLLIKYNSSAILFENDRKSDVEKLVIKNKINKINKIFNHYQIEFVNYYYNFKNTNYYIENKNTEKITELDKRYFLYLTNIYTYNKLKVENV